MQSTNKILMIRPSNFNYNNQTAEDNAYQNKSEKSNEEIQELALKEFDSMVSILKNLGIEVVVFEDTPIPYTPDSIFPNNWFSTHDKKIIIYPMYAENRRLEVLKFKDELLNYLNPKEVYDISNFVKKNKFLESTGAMVLDRINKIIYSSLSQRSDEDLIKIVAENIGYKYIVFTSHQFENEIYHTNVMLGITTDFAFVGLELIEEDKRKLVKSTLEKTHEIIYLNSHQIENFCGNILELRGKNGKFIFMSTTAYKNLTKEQINTITRKIPIYTADVQIIEKLGGGSVRCMMAELF